MDKQELREIIENELENDIEIIKAKQQHEIEMEKLKHNQKLRQNKEIIKDVFSWVVGIGATLYIVSFLVSLIFTVILK